VLATLAVPVSNNAHTDCELIDRNKVAHVKRINDEVTSNRTTTVITENASTTQNSPVMIYANLKLVGFSSATIF
jgi:hypothetical protein